MAEGGGDEKPKDQPINTHGIEKPDLTDLFRKFDEVEDLNRRLGEAFKIFTQQGTEDEEGEAVLTELTVDGVAEYIRSGQCKNIITMAGAGLSTSAGIPDFRSPGTGLYDNLKEYDLPSPQAIFEISYFRENPEPFFKLSKELWPGKLKPTPGHYFIRLLEKKGLLRRHFTQNIDTLEHVAGISADRIIEAHGTYRTSHCLECAKVYQQDWMKEKIFGGVTPHCEKDDCMGLVKPDIVFFGEQLPFRYHTAVQEDIPQGDLLIVMGTSLMVQPFASLPSKFKFPVPRLCINLEKPSSGADFLSLLTGQTSGFKFDEENNKRDVFLQGTCDDGCMLLAEKIGWGKELKELIKSEHAKLESDDTEKETAASKRKEGKMCSKAVPNIKKKL